MGERPAPHAQCRAAQNKRARWGATGDAGSGKRKPGQMEGGRAEKPAGGGGGASQCARGREARGI